MNNAIWLDVKEFKPSGVATSQIWHLRSNILLKKIDVLVGGGIGDITKQ